MNEAASLKSPLVELLQRFNRKERYWLLADAIGEPFLALSADYRARLGKILSIEVPAQAWWALDYHFDWLHAVLSCAPDFRVDLESAHHLNELSGARRKITGTQEDIDLIIAFGRTIILVEAKGVTGWTNGQMRSKAERLSALSYDANAVNIHLVLTSPERSSRLAKGAWVAGVPKAMMASDGSYYHLAMMGLGGGGDLLRVQRCDEKGKASDGGEWWRIVADKPVYRKP